MDFSLVELLLYDCDGVLTDNRVLVGEDGQEYAFFHRGDGYAVQQIRKLGITQAIISTETNPIVCFRAKKLHLDVINNVDDKVQQTLRCCEKYGISPENTMFIGNDLNDYDAMRVVGFCGCPRDAEPEICAISHWVSEKKGGEGVIRELLRELTKARK